MPPDQAREIDELVKKIWETQIKKDYNDCLIFEESALRGAFYHRLRVGMKKTLKDLVVYPEMRVRSPKGENLRIDLAVVEMGKKCDAKTSAGECERNWELNGSCITKLVAAFEFKHWERFKRAQGYDVWKDLKKIKKYSEGIYYHDDTSKKPKRLKAERTYLGILLDKDRTQTREAILGKRGERNDVRLLLGVDLGKKSEFRYMEPSREE